MYRSCMYVSGYVEARVYGNAQAGRDLCSVNDERVPY